MPNTYTHRKPKSGIYEFVYNLPMKHRRPGEPTQKRFSLRTRCPKQASVRAAPYIELYVLNETVRDLPEGKTVTRDMVAKQAKLQDLDYLDYKELDALPAEDLVEAAMERASRFKTMKAATQIELATLVGDVVEPLTFMTALEKYWADDPDRFSKLDPYKAELKRARDRRPVQDFIDRMGDIDLLKLTLKDCKAYRAKLVAVCEAGKMKSEQATWRICKLREIVREVFETECPNRPNPFEKVKSIKRDDAKKHEPFLETEIDTINETLPEAKISDAAKAIIVVSQMTGAIASELRGLLPEEINVDAEIPHIIIRPNKLRSLKTESRPRILPLFGEMLEVMKRYSNGFEDYHDNRGWQRLNRHLSDFFKKTTPGKSMYSNRHRIEDCLKAAGFDGGIRAEVKGHSVKGSVEYYGTERDILDIRDAMQKALTEGAAKKRERERRMTNQKTKVHEDQTAH